MTNCELCGANGFLIKTEIEGVILKVCEPCSKFGKIIKEPIIFKPKTTNSVKTENLEIINSDYANLIRNKREELGLSQKDFGIKVSEKQSVIHKLETGVLEPSMPLAKKLQRILQIKLISKEEATQYEVPNEHTKSESMTLGDMIKIKKK